MGSIASTLGEAAAVVAVGLGLGLGVNAVSADGLQLGRDHFPSLPGDAAPADDAARPDAAPSDHGATAGDHTPAEPAAPALEHDAAEPTTPSASDTEAGGAAAPAEDPFAPADVLQRLAARGLQPMTFEEARATFEDPMYELGAFAFVDARQPRPYAEGHIPGAWLFDRYRPDGYLADMQTLIATSQRLVVYCNGGQCDDSEFAAEFLRQFGARPDQLFVFVGGMEQWRHEDMPVETGARGSGDLEGQDG